MDWNDEILTTLEEKYTGRTVEAGLGYILEDAYRTRELMLNALKEIRHLGGLIKYLPVNGVEFMGERYQYLTVKCIHCGESALLGQRIYHLKTCAMVLEGVEEWVPAEQRPAVNDPRPNALSGDHQTPGTSCKEDGTSADELQKRIEELELLLDKRETALHQIADWAKAYPFELFPEPDFKKVRELLAEGGITIDAVSASNMRHVVSTVSEIAAQGLEPICA